MDSCGAERGDHPEYSLATFGYKTGYVTLLHIFGYRLEANREIFPYYFQIERNFLAY